MTGVFGVFLKERGSKTLDQFDIFANGELTMFPNSNKVEHFLLPPLLLEQQGSQSPPPMSPEAKPSTLGANLRRSRSIKAGHSPSKARNRSLSPSPRRRSDTLGSVYRSARRTPPRRKPKRNSDGPTSPLRLSIQSLEERQQGKSYVDRCIDSLSSYVSIHRQSPEVLASYLHLRAFYYIAKVIETYIASLTDK